MITAVPVLDFAGMRRIAVFRVLQLGDMLCTVPALRALRRAAPHAEVTLIGLPWAAGFVERFCMYLDRHMCFPGYPGMPESEPDMRALPDFFAAARERQFDLALQLHGSGGLSNPLTLALGAARTAGFYAVGDPCPDAATYALWSEGEHEVLRYLRLLQLLGVPSRGEQLAFPLRTEDHAALARAAPGLAPGSYVCIHPGARLPSRRWPPQRFAQVADGLAGQGWTVVITGSPDERQLTQAVRAAMRSQAIDLTGATTLGSLAALLAGARLLVCNDTGVSHVAAAMATPSVVVCSGADPGRWAPLDRKRHRVLHADVPCRPCAHRVCPIGHPCATGVSSASVLASAEALCREAALQS
jgi:ADP-heptose:LPS heptosyltransferase